jgi:zinc transport system substrate-binding protein
MRHVLISLFIVFVLAIPNADAAPLKVMVTIKPLHSLVAGVMEGAGTPSLLVDGHTSPHEFQLKPSQMQRMEQADIVFYMDKEFETFLQSALTSLPSTTQTVALSDTAGLHILPSRHGGVWEEPEHHESEDAHASHHHHHTGTLDPHLWLDPDNARLMVARIAVILAERDPAHQAIYAANAKTMQTRIAELDAKVKQELAGLEQTPFIVFHDAYQYLEAHYGLRAVGSMTLEPDESPSPARIQQLRTALQTAQVTCVFHEPYFSDRLVKTIIEGSNAHIGELDPEATTLEPGAGLYETLLRGLVDNMKQCLSH